MYEETIYEAKPCNITFLQIFFVKKIYRNIFILNYIKIMFLFHVINRNKFLRETVNSLKKLEPMKECYKVNVPISDHVPICDF